MQMFPGSYRTGARGFLRDPMLLCSSALRRRPQYFGPPVLVFVVFALKSNHLCFRPLPCRAAPNWLRAPKRGSPILVVTRVSIFKLFLFVYAPRVFGFTASVSSKSVYKVVCPIVLAPL